MNKKFAFLLIAMLIMIAVVLSASSEVVGAEDEEDDGELLCILGEHLWSSGTVCSDSTCSQKGWTLYECTREGCYVHKTEQNVPTKAHDYAEKELKPIYCGSDTPGITVQVCKVCGYEDPSSLRSYSVPPHKWLNNGWIPWEKATCTSAGTSYRKCGVCGCVEKKTVPMLSHSFPKKLTVKIAASCVREGVMEGYCEICKETVQVKTGYADHNWKTVKVGSVIRTRTCTVCQRSQGWDSYNGSWVTSVKGLSQSDNPTRIGQFCTEEAQTGSGSAAAGTVASKANSYGITIPATGDNTGALPLFMMGLALICLALVMGRIEKRG